MAPRRKPFSDRPAAGDRPAADRPRSLYVHVPFCRSRCRYCDFNSVVYDAGRAGRIVPALRAEMDRRLEGRQLSMRTAFIGGGTPSILPPGRLKTLLQAVARRCRAGAEFTVEVNPDSLSGRALELLIRSGVNRLSVGVQSFVDQELAVLGRPHSARQARRALLAARAAGLENVSVDLIYGIPGQSLRSWQDSLRQAIDLGVTHASCYGLSYPAGTAMAEDLAAGRIEPMDDDLQQACYDLAIDLLGRSGLRQYEISNFAAPGYRCIHNITYWKNRSYIGIGPGAVSYVDGWRSTNLADPDNYVRRIVAGADPTASAERLAGRRHVAESLMLMLRMRPGVNRRVFQRRFGVDSLAAFEPALERHRQWGTVSITSSSIRLSRKGLFVSDSVFADLLV